jgi:hypothetical protein
VGKAKEKISFNLHSRPAKLENAELNPLNIQGHFPQIPV